MEIENSENAENSIESKNLDDSIINKEFLEPLKSRIKKN